ncbi:Actin-related protein 4A, partial [Smittium mucronatum]
MPTYGGGEDSPQIYFPTDVGYIDEDCDGAVEIHSDKNHIEETADGDKMDIEEKEQGDGKKRRKYYVGNEGSTLFLPNKEVKKVVSQGKIEDWDAYERIVASVLTDSLMLPRGENPVLFSEPNWN